MMKRSTDDQVITPPQRDTRRWCRGIPGRPHNWYSILSADEYARLKCWMICRRFQGFGSMAGGDPLPDQYWWRLSGDLELTCEHCDKVRYATVEEYESGTLNETYRAYPKR